MIYSLNITAILDLQKPNFRPKHPTPSHQTCSKSRGLDRSPGPLSFFALSYAFCSKLASSCVLKHTGECPTTGPLHQRFLLPGASPSCISLFRCHRVKPEACPDYFITKCNPPPRSPPPHSPIPFPGSVSLFVLLIIFLPHKKVNPRRAGILGILHPKQHPKQVSVADGGSEREAECWGGQALLLVGDLCQRCAGVKG